MTLQDLEFDSKEICLPSFFEHFWLLGCFISLQQGRECEKASRISAFASTCWVLRAFLYILKLASTKFCDWIYFIFFIRSCRLTWMIFFTQEILLFNVEECQGSQFKPWPQGPGYPQRQKWWSRVLGKPLMYRWKVPQGNLHTWQKETTSWQFQEIRVTRAKPRGLMVGGNRDRWWTRY